ncbi:ABC transporter permease [Brooklawnia cerclae]|uniref:ABC transport system permease protein n=1 Tax=Brooklawnia cerclae TaxID=349934 RepID=A0ABX0SC61_9ACTN|nr:ABC transporter permease [Brooklawnia cerclae]NIH55615.1 putative ABC transport system permease protein [Brooklawnia cerclae]
MRITELVREILASARAQKVSTIMVALLAAAMCATTLLTVGRAAAAEQQVQARLDAAGSRTLAITDSASAGFLTRDVIAQIGTLDVAERAVGLTSAIDVTTATVGRGGERVASWQVVGDIPDVAILVRGRWPLPGEAIVSATAMSALALDAPVGAITSTTGVTYPVVGQFTARDPFTNIAGGVLINASTGTAARTLHVIATTPSAVPSLQSAVLTTLDQPLQNIQLDSPADLAQLQSDVMGDLTAYGRGLMLMVLGAGALLTAIVVLADVLLHRTDLGRRRALGAPRWVIVSLVTGRAAIAGAMGAILGTTATAIALASAGHAPVPTFAAGTGVLAVLAAAVAALPPAVAASHNDPVRVLRTP